MKVIFVLCTLAFAFGLISTNSAFGEIHTEYPRFHEINLQVIHRNANGDLMGYFESALAYVQRPMLLHEYLDTLDAKEIIKKDGQTLEVYIIHKGARGEPFTEKISGQFASYNLFYKGSSTVAIRHDGYYGEPGDTATGTFKIVRIAR